MNKILLATMLAVGIAVVSNPAMARQGADDPAGHVRGADHADGHVSGRDRVREVRQSGGGGDRVRVGGGGRDDRTGDAPRLRGEDGGVHQCRGCDDPTSGRNRDRSVPSTDD
jgi:hypothetical protein